MNRFCTPYLPYLGGFLSFVCLLQCSLHYDKLIHKTENYFFQGEFEDAIEQLKPIAKNAKKKDLLLYLLEVALIYHTQGNYQKSNELFKQADKLAEKTQLSISKEIASFLLNDQAKAYITENFEKVLIKFYIALNYLLINDFESAHRTFKKLQFNLKDLKHFDAIYKQNLMARYLNAILAEKFGNYNDARVEYKNIRNFYKNKAEFTSDQYVLAMKERDHQDIKRYSLSKTKVKAFNKSLNRVNYNRNMGELVIIHQAGKSVIKASRGYLRNDAAFMAALHVAVRVAMLSKNVALTTSGVMSTLYSAENPIPVYKFRDHRKSWGLSVYLNQKQIASTKLLNDYSKTIMKTFNDNYHKMIAKNVTSIAVKAVSSVIASYAAEQSIKQAGGGSSTAALAGILTGVVTGSLLGSTIKPDLRCWHLLPSNFQVERIFLEPGEYNVEIRLEDGGRILTQNSFQKINIVQGGLIFINVRSI